METVHLALIVAALILAIVALVGWRPTQAIAGAVICLAIALLL